MFVECFRRGKVRSKSSNDLGAFQMKLNAFDGDQKQKFQTEMHAFRFFQTKKN